MNIQNAIWAVDPFPKNVRQLANAQKALSTWGKYQQLKIQPVSMVTPSDLRWPIEYMTPQQDELQYLTQSTLQPLLRGLHMKNLKDPSVILDSSISRWGSIDQFLKYARKQKAGLIVVTTHERKGVGKFRLGGFTRTLIEKSPIPVLTVRPDSQVPTSFSRILFPTDFSKTSKQAFVKVLDLAKNLRAEIFIFHQLEIPMIWEAEMSGPLFQNLETLSDYSEKAHKQLSSKGEALVKMATEQKLKASFVLTEGNVALSRDILKIAKQKRADLIVMDLQPHAVARAILGSWAREVIETSPRPVLLL